MIKLVLKVEKKSSQSVISLDYLTFLEAIFHTSFWNNNTIYLGFKNILRR